MNTTNWRQPMDVNPEKRGEEKTSENALPSEFQLSPERDVSDQINTRPVLLLY